MIVYKFAMTYRLYYLYDIMPSVVNYVAIIPNSVTHWRDLRPLLHCVPVNRHPRLRSVNFRWVHYAGPLFMRVRERVRHVSLREHFLRTTDTSQTAFDLELSLI